MSVILQDSPGVLTLRNKLAAVFIFALAVSVLPLTPVYANPVPYSPLEPLPGFWVEIGPILFEAILLGALLGLRWYLVLPAALVANLVSFFVVPLLLYSTPLGSIHFTEIAFTWGYMWLLTVLIEAPIFSVMLNHRIPFMKSIKRTAFVCLVSIAIMDIAWSLSVDIYLSVARGGRIG
jgi:hypothetical protein